MLPLTAEPAATEVADEGTSPVPDSLPLDPEPAAAAEPDAPLGDEPLDAVVGEVPGAAAALMAWERGVTPTAAAAVGGEPWKPP